MKKIYSLLFLANCLLPIANCFSQDTITISSITAGNFELITEETETIDTNYTESTYSSTDSGTVISLITESSNERKSTTEAIDQAIKLTIYPNPGKGIYTVTAYNKTINKIEVTSILGETLAPLSQGRGEGGEVTVNISTLTKGVYFFKIICTDASTKTEKVVFQ